jgi:limonene-1,2-epoxide hydrolase
MRDPDPQTVVREFCAAWSGRNVDAILARFAPDAVYHNMPIAPVRGHAEIRSVLEMFVPPASKIEFEILAIAGSGNVVFTERVDRFTVGDKEIALPVAGVFEVRDGKITSWRDYFDMPSYQRQLG